MKPLPDQQLPTLPDRVAKVPAYLRTLTRVLLQNYREQRRILNQNASETTEHARSWMGL